MMTRRDLLAASFAAGLLHAKTRIGPSRIGAISDEIAKSPAGAIEFAKQYGIPWLELRGVPGGKGDYKGEYTYLSEERLNEAAKEFRANKIRISYLDTSLLKFPFPGVEP